MATEKTVENNQQENQMDKEEKQKEMLVKVTARIAQNVSDIIREIADEYGVSFSEVVRLSIDGHLENYLGIVRYIDKRQADEIKKQTIRLANEMESARPPGRRGRPPAGRPWRGRGACRGRHWTGCRRG